MSSRVENILDDTLNGVFYDKKPQSRVEELLSELNASGGGGAPGKNGKSAYELAVENGFKGTVEDWLKSLQGKSAYEIAVENGFQGTIEDWYDSIDWQDDVMSADDARALVQSIFNKESK